MKFDIIMVQETHSKEETASMLLGRLTSDFVAHHSWGSPSSGGGLLTLVRKSIISNTLSHYTTLREGRIARLSIQTGTSSSAFWNIHNFGLTKVRLSEAERVLKADWTGVRSQPSQRFVRVAGDFHFMAEGDARSSLKRPDAAVAAATSNKYRKWPFFKLLSEATELDTAAP